MFWKYFWEGVFINLTIFKNSKQKFSKALLDGEQKRVLRISLSSPEFMISKKILTLLFSSTAKFAETILCRAKALQLMLKSQLLKTKITVAVGLSIMRKTKIFTRLKVFSNQFLHILKAYFLRFFSWTLARPSIAPSWNCSSWATDSKFANLLSTKVSWPTSPNTFTWKLRKIWSNELLQSSQTQELSELEATQSIFFFLNKNGLGTKSILTEIFFAFK